MSTFNLSPEHQAQLDESGIAPEIIAERGYWTATRKAELAQLGFGRNQQLVSALVIPIYDVHGELRLYQARPDAPRIKDGKPIKYETPAGAGLCLDVPRRVRDQLRNPDAPLWITEGAKKVDSALSHGLCCIGVVGVYGWRGTNGQRGKTALADLEYIALNDRKVYLAFDSDAMEKPEVHQALDRFANLLASRGAEVRFVYIPSPDGRKVGLDDFLASGGTADDLLKTATSELNRLPSDDSEGEPEWEPSPEALAAGKRLLDDPTLLERAGKIVARLGVAGDLTNAKLLYLALVSRCLNQPINVVVSGESSAGKNHLVQAVVSMFPERATYTIDAMSERALIYLDADLRHRHLIVTEAAGLHHDGIGATIMRAIAWGGRVRYPTVEKTPSGLRSVMIDREGPTGLITTTTKRVEPELETRVVTLHVADTPEVTREVVLANARLASGNAPVPPDLEPWHSAQWWLAIEGVHEVTIPFAEQLANLLPAGLVRMRRDSIQIMNFIKASAILHQRQRERDERGRIVATRADYEIVYALAAGVFGSIAAEGATQVIRETVAVVAELTAVGDPCTIPQLEKKLGLARTTVDSRIRRAVEKGWLVNDEERPRRPAKLRVGEPLPEDRPALPSPDEVCSIHAPYPSERESSRRHCPGFADRDGQDRDDKGDDMMTRDDSTVTMRRQRDEWEFVTASADSHAENGDGDDVTTRDGGGSVRARIEINYGAFRTCRLCGGHNWWTADGDWTHPSCLDCEAPPTDAVVARQIGAVA